MEFTKKPPMKAKTINYDNQDVEVRLIGCNPDDETIIKGIRRIERKRNRRLSLQKERVNTIILQEMGPGTYFCGYKTDKEV